MSVKVSFVPRKTPLLPVAAACVGGSARALGRRLLRLSDEELGALSGVSGKETLLLLGDNEKLPWSPGIAYLGVDPDAPRLLLPTCLAPDVPLDLLEKALFSSGPRGPLAVLASPRLVISAAGALSIERAKLTRWLDR